MGSKEEVLLIVKDMESYLKFYTNKSTKLKAEIDAIQVFGNENLVLSMVS